MSLGTYAEARPWAKAIKDEILERRMPPWNAAKGFADYSNDRSLTQLETELLVDWVEGGAPKGEERDLPQPAANDAPPKPDLTVAGGISPIVKTQRWVSGWKFTPGSGAVKSAEFWIEDAAKKRVYLGGWVPPEGMVSWPDDVAQSLPVGSRIVVKLHFNSGNRDASKSRLALFFASQPPRQRVQHMQINCGATPIAAGLQVLAMLPEGPMEVQAALPDGSTDLLGLFRADNPDYHATYFFRRPVPLPGGSRISAQANGMGTCTAMLAVTRSLAR